MHALHCILVDIRQIEKELDKELDLENLKEVKEEILDYALEKTDEFRNQVFDYRSDDAGSWRDEYPDNVILGSENKERFLELLDKFSKKPLTAALSYFETLEKDKIVIDKKFIEDAFNDYHIDLFALHLIFKLINGEYDFASQFYSIPDGDSRLGKDGLEEIKHHPEDYALVLLDYHY